jgi:hypothetical protein
MKKTPKTIIIKQKPIKPFDLSFSKGTENAKIIVALESLKSNHGWQFMTQVLKENLKDLSDQIINKEDAYTGKVLTDAEVDVIREKYRYLNELLNKPDWFLERLTRIETQEEDLDPYQS